MTVTGLTITFFLSWWMVFLATLPIGVRSQYEDGDVTDGTEPAAPVAANLAKKSLWATIGAVIITLIVWGIMLTGWLSPENLSAR